MNFEIPEDTYQAILAEIESENSPVGIDAKHTHILILHQLEQLNRRLDKLEAQQREILSALEPADLSGFNDFPDFGDDLPPLGTNDFHTPDDSITELLNTLIGIVETQISELDPPVVNETYNRLINEGTSEEEAKHLIAIALQTQMFEAAEKDQDFNMEAYSRTLNKLPELPDPEDL